jgi:cellulose synthase/poly-beta-1,6-N-acetylglucosamine synthase-like glycosyltransferase
MAKKKSGKKGSKKNKKKTKKKGSKSKKDNKQKKKNAKSKKKKAVNKSVKKSKNKPKIDIPISEYPGVSIVTCTMRGDFMNNIFENYGRQDYPKKELIIVLNNNKMNIDDWKKEAEKYDNVRVFQVDEKVTLGNCTNYGVEQSRYEIIAKFDDDDYYGPKFLKESVKAFFYTDAGVVGKRASFVYFKKSKILALRNYKYENQYVKHMDGPTMLIKRDVFDKVRFADIPRAIDVQFCKDCNKKGIKIYSTDRYHHVYIRYENRKKHTWKITDKELLKWCKVIKKNVTNFEKYVNK